MPIVLLFRQACRATQQLRCWSLETTKLIEHPMSFDPTLFKIRLFKHNHLVQHTIDLGHQAPLWRLNTHLP